MRQITEYSAGAILFRFNEEDEPLYLLLKYPDYWGFPKGHVEPGETNAVAARREILEETGIRDIEFIPGFEQTITYTFRRGRDTLVQKEVTYFLVRTHTDRVTLSPEHEAYVWADVREAMRLLTYESLKELLWEAHNYILDHL